MLASKQRPATYADLEAAPSHLVAELIHGSLETHPRPVVRHANAASQLGYELIGAFQRGSAGGPGGWIFLDEPELHFGPDVVVPDIAAWRRERLPEIPDVAFMTLAPDWVCEILSPSTARLDRGPKRDIYARAGVGHLWLIEPRERVVEAFELTAGRWTLAGVATGSDDVSLAPFEAAAFSLDVLFPPDPPVVVSPA